MTNPDWLIYVAHGGFWGSFGLTRLLVRRSGRAASTTSTATPSDAATPSDTGPTAERSDSAPYPRALLALHMLAMGLMYYGIANAVIPNLVPPGIPGRRIVGAAIIALGAALVAWALVHFSSWRYRAEIEPGHRLATDGPFRIVRHPLYLGMNLLALGTAVWVPTPLVWSGLLVMIIGGDLRARSEEKLLRSAFGATYVDYCAKTKRFVPGVY